MIAFLNGRLDSIDDSYVYIDCGGVGYKVMMPSLDIAEIGNVGESIKVYTNVSIWLYFEEEQGAIRNAYIS